MQHQEGVVRNLCKFQGRLTSLSYANDVKCVALLRTWRTIKGKRPTSFRDFSTESNCKNFCLASQETCIAQNARMPSTEAFPADRRLYEGYGDRAEKGRLVVSSNRNRYQPRCVHGASPVAKMVGAEKCGTFEGSRHSQSDVSTRGSAHPPPSGGSPASHVYLHSSACARHPGCSNIDQNHFPSIG
ncbi:uncharacterized protein TNCV_517811 [Trichonephila clavipes]|nr:uncharacterized protein TNCV_517811 [Trichonephila clavipes]